MGMFNYLYCDMLLPDGKYLPKEEFQTKDLGENLMLKYRIDKNGVIWEQTVITRVVPKHERTLVKRAKKEGREPTPLESICGSMSVKHKGWRKYRLSGCVRFYARLNNEDWLEYLAYVENGKVFKLIVSEYPND
jgi:hypothetical protein